MKQSPKDPGPKLDFSDHLNTTVREYWWDYDFLNLMQRRLRLDKCRKALDLGCGMGHWTHTILPHLNSDAKIIGIDNNSEWVKEAIHQSNHRMEFEHGDAYSLPFPDESFDFITCQSFFMHLKRPEAALKEMYRVLKKKGQVFLVEINNYGNLVRVNSAQEALSIDERLQIAELYAILEEGKMACGDGFMGIHSMLPKILTEQKYNEVQYFKNDTTFNIYPPYKDIKQKVMLDFLMSFIEKGHAHVYPRNLTEKYFLAAKNDKDLYEKLMKTSDKLNGIYKQQIMDKVFEGTFGSDMVITTGTK